MPVGHISDVTFTVQNNSATDFTNSHGFFQSVQIGGIRGYGFNRHVTNVTYAKSSFNTFSKRSNKNAASDALNGIGGRIFTTL